MSVKNYVKIFYLTALGYTNVIQAIVTY